MDDRISESIWLIIGVAIVVGVTAVAARAPLVGEIDGLHESSDTLSLDLTREKAEHADSVRQITVLKSEVSGLESAVTDWYSYHLGHYHACMVVSRDAEKCQQYVEVLAEYDAINKLPRNTYDVPSRSQSAQ